MSRDTQIIEDCVKTAPKKNITIEEFKKNTTYKMFLTKESILYANIILKAALRETITTSKK